MSSVFSKIIAGEIPAHKVAETENCFAFLDISPLVNGHVLVVPKNETDYLFDVEDKDYNDLWIFARKIGKAIEKVIPCERIGVAVIGLEVPHAHIHLVPINSADDLNFTRTKLKPSKEDLELTASKIRSAFDQL